LKNCIITGASSGLGRSLLKELISENYTVLTIQRTPPMKHKNVHWIKADLKESDRLPLHLLQDWTDNNNVQLLINNAAKYDSGSFGSDQAREILAINLMSPIIITNIVEKNMTSGGLIININSVAGTHGMEYEPIYSASKHGLKGFSKSLRMQLSSRKINVLDIYPGGINTELWNDDNPYPGGDIKKTMNPKEIAALIRLMLDYPYREIIKDIVLYPVQDKHP
jgi:uncharacterized protein